MAVETGQLLGTTRIIQSLNSLRWKDYYDPTAEEAAGMFALFDSLSRYAPNGLCVDDQKVRDAALISAGINPARMTDVGLANEYFRLKRQIFNELRQDRSRLSRVFRRGRTDDNLEAEDLTNFALAGALVVGDASWIEPRDLALPTKGTLFEIGLMRRSINVLRKDIPLYTRRIVKSSARFINRKVISPLRARYVSA